MNIFWIVGIVFYTVWTLHACAVIFGKINLEKSNREELHTLSAFIWALVSLITLLQLM